MHYMIFIPDPPAVSGDDLLRSVGLEQLSDGNRPAEIDTFGKWHDSDPQPGVLLSWISTHGAPSPLSIDMDTQLWHKAPPDPARGLAAGRYWFGIDNAHPPTPLDILRDQQPSRPVELGDGNRWGVPIAKQLPHSWGVDPATGQFARTPHKPYDEFCRAAEVVYERFRHAEGLQITIGGAWEYACQALAVNYRVNHEIISFLELINDGNFLRIIEATIDLDMIRDVEDEKKK